MDGLVLELVSSSLPAYSALVVSQDWLTVPVDQQLGALTRLMLELPVLQVSLLALLQILFPTIKFHKPCKLNLMCRSENVYSL